MERDELTTRHKLAMLDEEEKSKRGLAETRREGQRLEDELGDMQTQMCEMVKEVSIAKRREDEYERRLGETSDVRRKLEQEIGVLQQSLQTVGSLGGGGNGSGDPFAQRDGTMVGGGAGMGEVDVGAGMVPASQLQVMKTTSEARMRQLTNELDFLRAQLESDAVANRELESALAASSSDHTKAQAEWRRMAAETEEARRRDIREIEDRCRAEMQVCVAVHSTTACIKMPYMTIFTPIYAYIYGYIYIYTYIHIYIYTPHIHHIYTPYIHLTHLLHTPSCRAPGRRWCPYKTRCTIYSGNSQSSLKTLLGVGRTRRLHGSSPRRYALTYFTPLNYPLTIY